MFPGSCISSCVHAIHDPSSILVFKEEQNWRSASSEFIPLQLQWFVAVISPHLFLLLCGDKWGEISGENKSCVVDPLMRQLRLSSQIHHVS